MRTSIQPVQPEHEGGRQGLGARGSNSRLKAGGKVSDLVIQAVASTVVVSLVSFIGLAAVPVSAERLKGALFVLVSLAAGAFFGDAIIHLLPKAFRGSENTTSVGLLALAGIFGFFVLEKFLSWRHQHGAQAEGLQPFGLMNLIADGVHNLIDGVAIGASYLAGTPVGLATTIAVILHEVPQEIGDFGVLLHAGFTKARALLFNFLTACTAVVGALVVVLVGGEREALWVASAMQALTAGMFLYIAGSDLVPDLHREQDPARSLVQLVAMTAGAGVMAGLALVE